MIAVGDFNLSKVKWGFQDVLHWLPTELVSDTTKSAASKLRNLLAPMDIEQFYPLHPSKGYSLVLLFSTLVVECFEAVNPLVRCDEHHIPAVFMLEAGVINTINVDRIVYNFNKANVQRIVNILNTAN